MTKTKLLYVDDETINLDNFYIAFRRTYKILIADSGQKALELFDQHDDIAMVVADQRMPGMSGVELLEKIRERNPEVVRIILTAYSQASDIIDSINKGHIYNYFLKPWKEEELAIQLDKAHSEYLLKKDRRDLIHRLQHELNRSKQLEERLVRRNMILDAVTEMSIKLLIQENLSDPYQTMLNDLAAVLNVSRAQLYKYHCPTVDCWKNRADIPDEEPEIHMVCTWRNEQYQASARGYEPTGIISLEEQACMAPWLHALSEKKTVGGSRTDMAPKFLPWLEMRGMQSITCVPLLEPGQGTEQPGQNLLMDQNQSCWGFFCFEDHIDHHWSSQVHGALQTGAALLGAAILREKMAENIAQQHMQLVHASQLTSLGEMASGIAHEINQPASVINLNMDLALRYISEPAAQGEIVELLQDSLGQVEKITRLITQMRRHSHIPQNERKKIDLVEPIERSLIFFQEQFTRKGICLDVQQDAPLPWVYGDEQKIEQVMVNLLRNAKYAVEERKHTEPDMEMQVSLTMTQRTLDQNEPAAILFTNKGKRKNLSSLKVIQVEVLDNGSGMDSTTLSRCLEPFFTTKNVGEGTGLGLSLTHTLIKEMGYHLQVDSTINQGSSFRILIPVTTENQS